MGKIRRESVGWRSNRHTGYRYRMGFHCLPGGKAKPAPAGRIRGLCMAVLGFSLLSTSI